MNSSQTVHGDHPYFPLGTRLPDYVPNTLTAPVLVATFAAGAATIMTTTMAIATRFRPGMTRGEMLTTMWFALCGCIHFFFEGYFALNYDRMPSRVALFGQLWKEYSLSDSRYLTQDSFIVTMEAITAIFWGPMSFMCAAFIIADHPLRHPFQLIVSLGQLYGDVLYYATCTFAMLVQNTHFCRPESFYFWAYYFFCNAFWIIIPSILIVSSAAAIKKAFSRLQQIDKVAKMQ